MKKIRVGVIGLGMGQAHIKGYREHPAAEVVAICDNDAGKLETYGEKFSIHSRYSSAKKMFAGEQLDVVSVVTPNVFHKDLTLAAFKAGCHVLCEKPMAMNAAEGRQMIAAAKKARKRLMINFSYRFAEQSYAMKQAVDEGMLGDIYYARTVWLRRRGMPGFGGWFGTKSMSGGGPLIDLGVHRLDMALWLMGYPKPVWVVGSVHDKIAKPIAKAAGKKFDVEDFASAMISFANGATLSLEASWAGNIAQRELMETRLLGTKGGMLQQNIAEGYTFDTEIFVERNGCQYDMKLHSPVPSAHSAYYHFIDCIVKNRQHVADGHEGLVIMELLDAIYRSAKLGMPVKV